MPFKRGHGSVKRRRLFTRVKAVGRTARLSSRKVSFKRTKGSKRKFSTKKGVRSLFKSSQRFKRQKATAGFNSYRGATVTGRIGGGRVQRRGAGWIRGRVAALGRKIMGKGLRGARDHYIVPGDSIAVSCDPALRNETWINVWGTGDHIALMLTAIRNESPYTLGGGANLLQPTLLVSGYSEIEILPVGVSPIHYEIVVGTPGTSSAQVLATTISNFNLAWASTYDARPTGYEFWPGTSLLENTTFWDRKNVGGLKPTHYFQGRREIGKVAKFTLPFKTRRYTYADYSNSTFLTAGIANNRSHRAVISVWGEPGQVCGVSGVNNQPQVAELGSQYIIRYRAHYFYKWIAGNNRPTVYGTQYASPELTPDDEALGFIGVPALRAQRGAAWRLDIQQAVPFPDYGAINAQRRHEANINPTLDCTGDLLIPEVTGVP